MLNNIYMSALGLKDKVACISVDSDMTLSSLHDYKYHIRILLQCIVKYVCNIKHLVQLRLLLRTVIP